MSIVLCRSDSNYVPTNREIERKYVIQNCVSLDEANARITDILRNLIDDRYVSGTDSDTYWPAPSGSNVNFIRLRIPTGYDNPELTVKTVDKGSNEDREELNVSLLTARNAIDFCDRLFGGSLGTIEKTFHRTTLTFSEVAVYQVTNDARLFLEVESHNFALIDAVVTMLKEGGLDLVQETRSIFQMFITKE